MIRSPGRFPSHHAGNVAETSSDLPCRGSIVTKRRGHRRECTSSSQRFSRSRCGAGRHRPLLTYFARDADSSVAASWQPREGVSASMVYLSKKVRLALGAAAAQLGFEPSTSHYGIDGKQGPLTVRVYGDVQATFDGGYGGRRKLTCYEVDFPVKFTIPTGLRISKHSPPSLGRYPSKKWKKVIPPSGGRFFWAAAKDSADLQTFLTPRRVDAIAEACELGSPYLTHRAIGIHCSGHEKDPHRLVATTQSLVRCAENFLSS